MISELNILRVKVLSFQNKNPKLTNMMVVLKVEGMDLCSVQHKKKKHHEHNIYRFLKCMLC